MIRRTAAVFGTLVLVGLAWGEPSHRTARCSCLSPPPDMPREEIIRANAERVEAVLLAAVMDTVPRTDELPALARLDVKRWWKGGERDTLTVAQHSSNTFLWSCDYPLTPGREYLLYLQRSHLGLLQASWCSGTTLATDSIYAETIRSLGVGRLPTGR